MFGFHRLTKDEAEVLQTYRKTKEDSPNVRTIHCGLTSPIPDPPQSAIIEVMVTYANGDAEVFNGRPLARDEYALVKRQSVTAFRDTLEKKMAADKPKGE